jgi:hypothetical protein
VVYAPVFCIIVVVVDSLLCRVLETDTANTWLAGCSAHFILNTMVMCVCVLLAIPINLKDDDSQQKPDSKRT